MLKRRKRRHKNVRAILARRSCRVGTGTITAASSSAVTVTAVTATRASWRGVAPGLGQVGDGVVVVATTATTAVTGDPRAIRDGDLACFQQDRAAAAAAPRAVLLQHSLLATAATRGGDATHAQPPSGRDLKRATTGPAHVAAVSRGTPTATTSPTTTAQRSERGIPFGRASRSRGTSPAANATAGAGATERATAATAAATVARELVLAIAAGSDRAEHIAACAGHVTPGARVECSVDRGRAEDREDDGSIADQSQRAAAFNRERRDRNHHRRHAARLHGLRNLKRHRACAREHQRGRVEHRVGAVDGQRTIRRERCTEDQRVEVAWRVVEADRVGHGAWIDEPRIRHRVTRITRITRILNPRVVSTPVADCRVTAGIGWSRIACGSIEFHGRSTPRHEARGVLVAGQAAR